MEGIYYVYVGPTIFYGSADHCVDDITGEETVFQEVYNEYYIEHITGNKVEVFTNMSDTPQYQRIAFSYEDAMRDVVDDIIYL